MIFPDGNGVGTPLSRWSAGYIWGTGLVTYVTKPVETFWGAVEAGGVRWNDTGVIWNHRGTFCFLPNTKIRLQKKRTFLKMCIKFQKPLLNKSVYKILSSVIKGFIK